MRREIKNLPLFLDAEKTQPIHFKQSATFLGVTFANTGTFHMYIRQALKRYHERVKMLKKFAGVVSTDTI